MSLHKLWVLCLASWLLAPAMTLGASPVQLTGTVTKVVGNRVVFKTNSALVYDAETSVSQLVRRNGSPLVFSEMLVGDKVQVTGQVWPDHSMTAQVVRNMSLYAHAGGFSGKITAMDTASKSFTLQSGTHGSQSIQTSGLTVISKQSTASTFNALEIGMTAQVKGVWERSRNNVLAQQVKATFRLLNIDIVGDVVMKNGTDVTIVSGGVIYSIDASKAKLRSRNNKPLTIIELPLNQVRVQGKHIAERTHITASVIKSLILSK